MNRQDTISQLNKYDSLSKAIEQAEKQGLMEQCVIDW